MDAYTVRPRDTQNGYKLEGKRLSYGRQFYRYQEDAISYAKWNSRLNGCKIDILCDQDKGGPNGRIFSRIGDRQR